MDAVVSELPQRAAIKNPSKTPYVGNYLFALALRLIWAPHVVYCISQGSYRTTLYLGRGGPQDQDARVRHARYVCRSYSQKYRYTKNRPIGVTVVFANGIYTPSAHDARVRLGLVALPFPSRASFDKIPGRYSIRRAVIKNVARGPCRQFVGSKNLIGRIALFILSTNQHTQVSSYQPRTRRTPHTVV